MGYTGNEKRKLKFGLIFLDFWPYTIAHHSDIALSHVSIAKSIPLVLKDQLELWEVDFFVAWLFILLTCRCLTWVNLSIIQSTRKFPPAIFIDGEFVGAIIEFKTGTFEENTFLKSNRFCLTVLLPISFNLSVSRMITFSSCLTQRFDVFYSRGSNITVSLEVDRNK